ncbi:hypothetical protein ACJMK2_004753 [Sinanodonta woodiana]|uniref:SGNH hydrolase-type esterase domain-containing protein n=1 Tax=Sinanodonta woodiana TaxID=1069815 RepID=A0ABD3VMZ1_SINWO
MEGLKVHILGSSFVRRLMFFTGCSSLLRTEHMNVTFDGRSGAVIPDFFDSELNISYIPDVVFIKLGENDIERFSRTEILANILRLVITLKEKGVRHVFVCQLLPRKSTRTMTPKQFYYGKRFINRRLSRLFHGQKGVTFQKIRKFRNIYMHRNGVHLSNLGNRWLLKNIISLVKRHIQ